ncbi:MAG: cbb3-type cytochrome c oxidase subunit I, partial [Thermoleophilia bacterium]|nr:cbb3-type cytochrome c oxidase subunit I [Thermoleophilia bacterium]
MEAGVVTPPRGEIAHPRAAEYGSAKPRSEQRTIGWLFGCTALALIGLMGVGGLIMRLDQAHAIHISPSLFYRIMTIHGVGMIVAAVLAMSGGIWFAMRETLPLSFNRMLINWSLTVAGALTALVSVLFGGFATGWTFLFPLPFHSAGQWGTWAAVGYLLGLALVAIGFYVLCIEMVLKTLAKYGGIKRAIGYEFLRGRDDDPPPPPVIAGLAVGIQGIVTTGMGLAIVFALLTRALDSSTYINALWAKNLTYHYGHTLANLAIYLAAGFLYMLLPRYAGRPWKTSKPIVIGWMATIFIVLTAYSHHLYMDFAQPAWAAGISMVASSAAAIPVAVVTIYTGMMLVWGSRYRWTLASTLLYLGFAGWAIGGVGAVIDSLVPVNFHFHNTLWVPAHFHTYMMLGIAMWALALVGYLLEHAAGEPSARFARIAAPVLLMVGGYGLVGGWYVSGALGVPRRYADHFGGVTTYSVVAAIAALTFATGVLIVFVEYLRLALVAKSRGGFRAAPAGAGARAGAGA